MKVSVTVIGTDAGAIERLTAAANRKLAPALRAAGRARQAQGATSAAAPTPLGVSDDDANRVPDPTVVPDIAIDPELF